MLTSFNFKLILIKIADLNTYLISVIFYLTLYFINKKMPNLDNYIIAQKKLIQLKESKKIHPICV